MKNFEIMNTVTRNLNRVGFQLKKHSPEILIVTGIIGVVTSAVMACKATTKINDILEDTKTQVEKVHTVLEDESIPEETYSEEDSKKDLAIIYAKTGLSFVKLYGPSILLGAISIASIITSNNILRKRNIALAAAYTVVDTGFKEYRGRVIERFGEEIDKELKYNIKAENVKETFIDKDGSEKTVDKTVEMTDPHACYSNYARFYDDGCKGWTKDPELNLVFLKQMQQYANDRLRARGHLFLNEVYDMLGIPHSSAGQIVGWIYDEDNPVGDNYVDFGIYDTYKEKSRDFVNGYERVILLDFNVDGIIYNLI